MARLSLSRNAVGASANSRGLSLDGRSQAGFDWLKVGKIAMPKGKRGGSYPGQRRGGRKRGTPNKRSVAQLEAAVAGGLMPLEQLLKVMRDPSAPLERRMYCAIAAAPYCHAKLKAIEHTGLEG